MQHFSCRKYQDIVSDIDPIKVNGRVNKVVGLVIEGYAPRASIGELCEVYPKGVSNFIHAEVVGFKDNQALLMPLGDIRGIGPESRIVVKNETACLRVGKKLLGRVIDGLGNSLDGKGTILTESEYPIYSAPINPLHRKRIQEPLDLGIRSMNALLTCGKGQRIGIFSGSGVGKSVLLGMIAKNTSAQVNVIALIGERGREVKDFIEKDLGEEGLKRSVVIAATSDQPPLIRMRGAYIATAIAEYFRDKGKDVILMMDSVTRFAMAQREIGLAIGEPPTTKGYTPSVFSLLPKLLERAGTSSSKGSVTGLYTVLVEGDDLNDPIADSVRSILDGHIFLSRELASQNQYPAIDMLNSISRVMVDIVTPRQQELAKRVIDIVATYKKTEDLVNIGAYVPGSNQKIDYAVKMIDRVKAFLTQGMKEKVIFEESLRDMELLFREQK